MTKLTARDRKLEGAFFADDAEFFKDMLEPSYDWTRHSTKELLVLLRSQLGREVPEFNAKFKEILATRPNIPTKQQAKAARIEKAKQQKNR